MQRRVIVMPPSTSGGRRVREDGGIPGIAYHLRDFQEFLRRAGLDPEVIDPTPRTSSNGAGAGPGVWT